MLRKKDLPFRLKADFSYGLSFLLDEPFYWHKSVCSTQEIATETQRHRDLKIENRSKFYFVFTCSVSPRLCGKTFSE